MPNRTKAELKHHYATYQGTPEQIKRRAQRNKARREMIAAGKAHVGDGKDVGHKRPIRSGGGNGKSNLAMQSKHYNRGWESGGKNR
jgi:hypothetical protein